MKQIQERLPLGEFPLKLRFFQRTGRLETSVPYSHWHDQVEIVYCLKGYGVQQVNETFFVIPPGSFALIGPNQLHSYAACSPEEELLLWVFQFDLSQLLAPFRQEEPFCRDWLSGRLLFPRPIPGEPGYFPLLQDIRREWTDRKDGYPQAISGCLLQLLTRLYRENPQRLSLREAQKISGRDRALLAQTFQLLGDRYQEESLSLQQAAQAANLSVSHFCRLFHWATGTTFHDYLNQYRISLAEQLLAEGKSCTQAAMACGFGSVSAFTRNYKKYRGVPPRTAKKNRSP
jgi:AraC-like DNA-binding protein